MVDVNILNERKRKVDHVAIVTSIFDYCSPRWKIFREVLFKLRGGGGGMGGLAKLTLWLITGKPTDFNYIFITCIITHFWPLVFIPKF